MKLSFSLGTILSRYVGSVEVKRHTLNTSALSGRFAPRDVAHGIQQVGCVDTRTRDSLNVMTSYRRDSNSGRHLTD